MSMETTSFPFDSSGQTQSAWVIFSGESSLKSVRFLRRGFKHCYVLLHDGERWISADPLAHKMEILAHELPSTFNLPAWLRAQGNIVVKAIMNEPVKKPAPVMPLTCVEVAKRILGVHKRTICTPYQLYRHLNKTAS